MHRPETRLPAGSQSCVTPERQTVAQFLRHWHGTVVRVKNSPKTVRSYEQLIRIHLVPGLGRHQLSKLTAQHVQSFLNERHASGLSARTVQYLRGVLRAALAYAVRWDLVPRNVAALATPPTVRQKEMTTLTPDEARRFLEAARGHRLEALFSVALAVGLRLGEALGLEWADIDFEAGTLAVSKQLQRVNGKMQLVPTKTPRSHRTVPLPPFALDALRSHRARQLEERLWNADRWQNSNLVFTTTIGTPADERRVRRELKALLADAGLPDLRFHDLRHTCASLLLAQGVHPRVVMEILGHSQITLTLQTYSHVIPSLTAEAATKMQRAVGAQA
jgi:integrase